MRTSRKTEEIKIRVEPLDKAALQQIADREHDGELSVVARFALKDFLFKKQNERPQPSLYARA